MTTNTSSTGSYLWTWLTIISIMSMAFFAVQNTCNVTKNNTLTNLLICLQPVGQLKKLSDREGTLFFNFMETVSSGFKNPVLCTRFFNALEIVLTVSLILSVPLESHKLFDRIDRN